MDSVLADPPRPGVGDYTGRCPKEESSRILTAPRSESRNTSGYAPSLRKQIQAAVFTRDKTCIHKEDRAQQTHPRRLEWLPVVLWYAGGQPRDFGSSQTTSARGGPSMNTFF